MYFLVREQESTKEKAEGDEFHSSEAEQGSFIRHKANITFRRKTSLPATSLAAGKHHRQRQEGKVVTEWRTIPSTATGGPPPLTKGRPDGCASSEIRVYFKEKFLTPTTNRFAVGPPSPTIGEGAMERIAFGSNVFPCEGFLTATERRYHLIRHRTQNPGMHQHTGVSFY